MKTILNVEGMSCQHCVDAVTKGLLAVEGVQEVAVDLDNKTVSVEHQEGVSRQEMEEAIEDQGFDVVK